MVPLMDWHAIQGVVLLWGQFSLDWTEERMEVKQNALKLVCRFLFIYLFLQEIMLR